MQEQDQERCKDLNHQRETAMKEQEVLLKECLRAEKEVTRHHLFQRETSQPKRKLMHLKKIILEFSIRLLLSMKTPLICGTQCNRNSSLSTLWTFLAPMNFMGKKMIIEGQANLENEYTANHVLSQLVTCQVSQAQATFLESTTK